MREGEAVALVAQVGDVLGLLEVSVSVIADGLELEVVITLHELEREVVVETLEELELVFSLDVLGVEIDVELEGLGFGDVMIWMEAPVEGVTIVDSVCELVSCDVLDCVGVDSKVAEIDRVVDSEVTVADIAESAIVDCDSVVDSVVIVD